MRSEKEMIMWKATRVILIPLLLLLPFSVSTVATAAESSAKQSKMTKEEMLRDPYFVALMQLQLQKSQAKKFQKLINRYAQKRGKAIDKEKRRYKGDLNMAIARAHDKLRPKFEKDMKKLLTEEQFQRFPPFLAELESMLSERESLEENNNPADMFENR